MEGERRVRDPTRSVVGLWDVGRIVRVRVTGVVGGG